ncbi:MAG: aspartyl protease family protein [Rhizomicrobium sp.]
MIRASLLALLVIVSAARADDLSSVVDRYVAWRGGEAFEHLQSVHQRGTLDTAGLHGTGELWADRSGRQRIESDLGVIKQTQVMTPEQSWEITPSGQLQIMAQSDVQSLSRYEALQFPDALRGGARAALRAPEIRDGQSWAVIRVTFGDEDTYDVFIDHQTGALGGFRIVEERRGRFESFADWRFVDGVRMPFLLTTKTEVPGGDQTVKVTSMQVNEGLAAALFARPVPVHKAVFRNGASSTGWIDFEFYAGNRIFFPAKINGHDAIVLLDSGATVSAIDKPFAAAIGLGSKGDFTAPGSGGIDTMGFVGGIEIQIGNLVLRDVNAASFDFAAVAKSIGHPMPFVLGDEVFNELAVDIDFAHHRLAFRDPDHLAKPADAVEVPLRRIFGNRSVPVSIEGNVPVEFEFDLGNGAPLDIYPAFYQTHDLLTGRRSSQLLGGGIGGYRPETVASLSRVSFAGIDFHEVPATFSPDTLSGANSNRVVGNIGLSILARFRLIIDYSHDRLYATPYADATSVPFAKDRLGLSFVKDSTGLVVKFVSPNSPAQTAGFKAGDKIVSIDQKPVPAWSDSALVTLRYAPAGTTMAFTADDGTIRRVKLADFF